MTVLLMRCKPWHNKSRTKGYGIKQVNGRRRQAHVVVWEEAHGPLPPGLVVDHLCRNPECVELSHLEAVTQRENVRRGNSAWAQFHRGRCAKGHDLALPGAITSGSKKRCRTCWNDYMRSYKMNRKKV